MSDYTKNLQLLRQYLEDPSDKRFDNPNWDIIDELFHPERGHIHDGEDSPEVYLDLTDVWAEIDKLYKLIAVLRADHTRLNYFTNQFYLDYSRHNHGGVETLFTETFQDLENTRQGASTMVVNPHARFLTLPNNYQPNRRYTWVGRVFNLNQDPDPAVTPTTAEAKIVASKRGDFTPFLAVGDNLNLNSNLRYPQSKAGQLEEVTAAPTTSPSIYSFAGKGQDIRNGTNHVPHRAWHWYGIGRPPLSKFRPRYAERDEFTPAQYHRSFTKKDPDGGREVVFDRDEMITTELPFEDAENTYEEIATDVEARPLYSGGNVLAWDRDSNTFYWVNGEDGGFERILDEDLGVIPQENMVEVAAGEDRLGNIYVLKSWVLPTEFPPGHFQLRHQIIKWVREEDKEEEFIEGNTWIGATMPRLHWIPNVIAPTHLEIRGESLYIYTELSWEYKRHIGNGQAVNYYADQDDYPWFPFGKVYGSLHKQRKYITMLYFDPAIMGTLKTMSLSGNEHWIPGDKVTVIDGQFPQGNSFSTYSEAAIKDFQGGNDNVYLGMNGDEMVFYQSFVPYDGDDILNRDIWNEDWFLNENSDKAWHGLIKYNVKTGTRDTVIGDIPFRVNAAGVMFEDEAYLMDGIELVKQWVVEEETSTLGEVSEAVNVRRLVAAAKSTAGISGTIKGSFWVARASAKAKVNINKGQAYASASASIKANTNSGSITAVSSSRVGVSRGSGNIRVSSRAVAKVRTGGGRARASARASVVISTGGKRVSKPHKVRPPRNAPPNRNNKKENNGIQHLARACQLFTFYVGDMTEQDTIRVHYSAASKGVYPHKGTGVPFEGAEWRGVEMLNWRRPNWAYLRGGARADNHQDQIGTISASDYDDKWVHLWLRSNRRSDRHRGIISRLHLNYIYITVERQGYIYTYTWDDLTQGSEAAMMIDARGRQRDAGVNTNEQNGIEILGIQANVTSSK